MFGLKRSKWRIPTLRRSKAPEPFRGFSLEDQMRLNYETHCPAISCCCISFRRDTRLRGDGPLDLHAAGVRNARHDLLDGFFWVREHREGRRALRRADHIRPQQNASSTTLRNLDLSLTSMPRTESPNTSSRRMPLAGRIWAVESSRDRASPISCYTRAASRSAATASRAARNS